MKRLVLFVALILGAVLVLPPLLAGPLGWRPEPLPNHPSARSVGLPDGRALNVVDVGSGVPIVLVHGLPGHVGDWAPQIEALRAAGPYRVIAYDRVGFGHSTRQTEEEAPYTYASNARELLGLLDSLDIERAALVGWSYGGGVVQDFAIRHPDRVSHLVLVASVGPELANAGEPAPIDELVTSAFGESLMSWVGSVPPLADAMARQNLAIAFARAEAIPTGFVASTRSALAMPGTTHAWRMESRQSDPSGLLPESIQTPTLVIQGADDYLVPYSVGEDLDRRLPRSKLVPVLSGSHMVPVTHPEVLAAAIHDEIGAY